MVDQARGVTHGCLLRRNETLLRGNWPRTVPPVPWIAGSGPRRGLGRSQNVPVWGFWIRGVGLGVQAFSDRGDERTQRSYDVEAGETDEMYEQIHPIEVSSRSATGVRLELQLPSSQADTRTRQFRQNVSQ